MIYYYSIDDDNRNNDLDNHTDDFCRHKKHENTKMKNIIFSAYIFVK